MSKQEIFLLFIEDDSQLHINFKKETEMFNERDADITIVPTCVLSMEAAISSLKNSRYDIIVTDLKLATGTPDKDAVTIGNDFIRQLKNMSPCPIAILTGKPTDVDTTSLDLSSMAKFVKDSEAESQIFQWLKTKLSLVRLMRESYKLLNNELAPLFHGGVASRISTGQTSIPADSALRVILENVADSILTVNSTTKCHPQESYILPVTRNQVMTGDLINYSEQVWVILTPACDIIRCAGTYKILLARCRGHEKYGKYLENASKGDFSSLTSLINQSNNVKTHFLPPIKKGSEPYIVDFEDLLTVEYSNLTAKNIIAAISPKFLPNLIHRFSAYLGRPGAPDIDSTHCMEHSQA